MEKDYPCESDEMQEIKLVDDTHMSVSFRCPDCGKRGHISSDLFYAQDIGEEEYYLACIVNCRFCEQPLKVVHPEVF